MTAYGQKWPVAANGSGRSMLEITGRQSGAVHVDREVKFQVTEHHGVP
jgi:hypothetical protein